MKALLWTIVFTALTCWVTSPKAEEQTWIHASVASYHIDRDKHYNERNAGIGMERTLGRQDTRLVAGIYDNSFARESVYFGISHTPWQPLPYTSVGAFVGCFTGYVIQTKCAPIPLIAIEGKSLGLNLMVVPPIKDFAGVLGLQVKYRFN